MRICDLQIENFRGIKSARIRFGAHAVLVGPNNSGKTTIIEALVLLFGRDRLIRDLTEHDFYGGSPRPEDRISIVATITGFEPNDPSQHRNWFKGEFAVEKWYDPTSGKLFAEKTDENSTLALQVAFAARFDRELLEVETVRYFYDDDRRTDPFDDDSVNAIPRHLIAEFGFFLVPASRTWDAVISFGSELFRRVIDSENAKPFEPVLAERDRLRDPKPSLEGDKAMASIVGNVDRELEGFFRSKPRLRLRVTSTDSRGVLDAVVPHYQFEQGGLPLPARRHGSGLVSLQRVLLLLHFGRQRNADGKNFWMALEEPELHVPPPLQRRLMHRLQALTAQTFATTHSPMVATLADPTTVLFLRNDQGALSAEALQNAPLQDSATSAVRKLFQINRLAVIDALLHDVVLVPEGRIDKDWLELLVRAVDAKQGWTANEESRFGSYVGVVPTQDGAVASSWKALRHLHPRLIPLVDGDAAGLAYASDLISLATPPAIVLRWCNDWTIEDVVGWVLAADSGSVESVNAVLDSPVTSLDDLVARLKSKEHVENGLKQNNVAYEAIASVIGESSTCTQRARTLLNGISDRALGAQTALFVDDDNAAGVAVFRP